MARIFKAIQKFVKAEDDGTVEAVFATMGVKDKDGDVTLSGFFGSQEVVMVPGHDWKHVPLGKGVIGEEGNEAIARLKMNLEIPEAKSWHSAIKFDLKNGTPLQQYSYGFDILEGGSEWGEFNGEQVRFLKARPDGSPGSKVWEVSPVLVGAGEGTRTLSAKGLKFCDEGATVLAAVKSFVERGSALAALREKDGRKLSEENRERMASMSSELAKAAELLAGLAVKEPDVEAIKNKSVLLETALRLRESGKII